MPVCERWFAIFTRFSSSSNLDMVQPGGVPTHVAFIMDGNGRWARQKGLPRTMGHKKGADTVRLVVESAIQHQIPYLTLFGFSSENWSRPQDEVQELMGLLRLYLGKEIREMIRNQIRLRVIGDRQKLPKDVQEMVTDAEHKTKNFTKLNLTIALSYGGRQDIVQAVQKIALDVQSGKISPEEIDPQYFSQNLSSYDLPDPDLVIRTSGEQRISNFLLWESAYAEYSFPEIFWPDFKAQDFAEILNDFSQRERRYGGT